MQSPSCLCVGFCSLHFVSMLPLKVDIKENLAGYSVDALLFDQTTKYTAVSAPVATGLHVMELVSVSDSSHTASQV